MQLPHLFEQRLEHLLVHDERTLLRLAAETAECLHKPPTHAPLVLQEQDAAKLSEPGRWIVERPENALAVFDRQGEDQVRRPRGRERVGEGAREGDAIGARSASEQGLRATTDSRRGERGAVSEWTQRERR
jgi:hypothetical protein